MKITGEIKTASDGRPIEEGFRDGFGRPVDGIEGLFPIVQMGDDNPWRPIGTGFFISNNGMFVTAKHVVLDNGGQLIKGLAGIQLLRRENRIIVRQAKKIVVHPKADVAVGFLFDKRFAEERIQTVNKFFALTTKTPELGSKVVTIAFPKGDLTGNATEFRLKLETAVIEGTMEAYHPAGRDTWLLPSRCFQTSMHILGGASGGPVAFGDGGVFGINSTGYDGIPVSFISSVEDILKLEVNHLQLPDGEIRERCALSELVERGLIIVR